MRFRWTPGTLRGPGIRFRFPFFHDIWRLLDALVPVFAGAIRPLLSHARCRQSKCEACMDLASKTKSLKFMTFDAAYCPIYDQARGVPALRPMVRASSSIQGTATYGHQDPYLGRCYPHRAVCGPWRNRPCAMLPACGPMDRLLDETAQLTRGEWITRAVDLATMPMYVKAGRFALWRGTAQCPNSIGPIVGWKFMRCRWTVSYQDASASQLG
jgi:hypothetical protein